MTIATVASKTTQQGNNATTVWNYAFPIPNQASIAVTLTDANGNQTLLAYGSQYTATGLGGTLGGTVTYPLAGTPLAPGNFITIQRLAPYQQLVNLINQGGFYPAAVEGGLDYLAELIQQLQEQATRAMTFGVATDMTVVSGRMPTPTANAFLAFNASGNAVVAVLSSPGSLVIPVSNVGAIYFNGAGGTVTQDPSFFSWDITNHQLLLGAGSATHPSYSFVGDAGTGLYLVSPDHIGVAIAGSLIGTFSSSGLDGIVIGSVTPEPGTFTALTISGGAITMSAANSRIIPGATDWGVRNHANSQDNMWLTDSGALNVPAVVFSGQFNTSGGASLPLLTSFNVLGADVNLNNVGTYFDGPSNVGGGTGGTHVWFVSGSVTLTDTAAGAEFEVKLWDGTTVIASASVSTTAANQKAVVSLSGFLSTNDANHFKISVKDITSVSGKILANQSGNGKDSTLTAIRIGP